MITSLGMSIRGYTRMTKTIKKKLWWKGMNSQIQKYVDSCVTCKKFKKSRKKCGKLPVKEINDEIIPWETVQIDVPLDHTQSQQRMENILSCLLKP